MIDSEEDFDAFTQDRLTFTIACGMGVDVKLSIMKFGKKNGKNSIIRMLDFSGQIFFS